MPQTTEKKLRMKVMKDLKLPKMNFKHYSYK